MDPPDGVQMSERYGESLLIAINESNKEFKSSLMDLMKMFGKTLTNSEKKVDRIELQLDDISNEVQAVASQSEKKASQADKRIGFLEEKVKRLEHLQKNLSRSERERESEEWRRQQKRKRESRRAISRRPLTVFQKVKLVRLNEVQLRGLMKGSDCVKFIGKLVLSSFPEGYFLVKENSFTAAVSSHHMDTFFGIVYNRFEFIKRRGKPSKPLTKKEITEVMRNKVVRYRMNNRDLIK